MRLLPFFYVIVGSWEWGAGSFCHECTDKINDQRFLIDDF
jgi:hypothetical protein